MQNILFRLYLPEVINNEKFTESHLFEYIDFHIKNIFSKCLMLFLEKEVNFVKFEQSNVKKINFLVEYFRKF